MDSYCSKYKEEGEEFKTLIDGVLPEGWADDLPTFTPEDKGIATRLHSQTMLNALAPVIPGFWGGSAGASQSLAFSHLLVNKLCAHVSCIATTSFVHTMFVALASIVPGHCRGSAVRHRVLHRCSAMRLYVMPKQHDSPIFTPVHSRCCHQVVHTCHVQCMGPHCPRILGRLAGYSNELAHV